MHPAPNPLVPAPFAAQSRTRTPQSRPFPDASSAQHTIRKLRIAASSSSGLPHIPFARFRSLPQHTRTRPDCSIRQNSRPQNKTHSQSAQVAVSSSARASRSSPFSETHAPQTLTHANTRCRELSRPHDHPETPATAWPGHVRNRQPALGQSSTVLQPTRRTRACFQTLFDLSSTAFA